MLKSANLKVVQNRILSGRFLLSEQFSSFVHLKGAVQWAGGVLFKQKCASVCLNLPIEDWGVKENVVRQICVIFIAHLVWAAWHMFLYTLIS